MNQQLTHNQIKQFDTAMLAIVAATVLTLSFISYKCVTQNLNGLEKSARPITNNAQIPTISALPSFYHNWRLDTRNTADTTKQQNPQPKTNYRWQLD